MVTGLIFSNSGNYSIMILTGHEPGMRITKDYYGRRTIYGQKGSSAEP